MKTVSFNIAVFKPGWLSGDSHVLKGARRRRRAICFVVGIATLVFGQATFADFRNTWEFDVNLDGKTVGYHQFTVADEGAGHTITSDARFDVKLLFVTVFSYRHTSVETWKQNCLTSIEANTSSNGKALRVSGRADETGLTLSSSAGNANFKSCIKTFAYWNPAILEAGALLNSQTGDYVEIEVTPLGDDVIVFDDREVSARKFSLRSKPGAAEKPVDIVLWYSTDAWQWLGLESTVSGNRVLRYQPTRVPQQNRRLFASTE